jgi:hypothetical protein
MTIEGWGLEKPAFPGISCDFRENASALRFGFSTRANGPGATVIGQSEACRMSSAL